MQTRQEMFLEVLGAENTQFVIPVYQRVYSWSERQCLDLWTDINRAGGTKTQHFIGTVLYAKDPRVTDVRQLDIIDGQQRTATLTIIIAALANHLRAQGSTVDDIDADFLTSHYLHINGACKLKLSRTDRATLAAVVDQAAMPEKVSERIVSNYEFFCSKMKEPEFDAARLWHGLQVLLVIEAELGEADRPQLIFESLNSKGMPLTTADLVRNYLLIAMDHDKQTELYEEYWGPIDSMFGDDPESAKLNAAIRAWLSIRFPKVRIHDKSETYSVFKTYLEEECDDTIEEILDELRGFCYMWAENYNFHEVKEFRSMDWTKGKRKTLVPERASQGGF